MLDRLVSVGACAPACRVVPRLGREAVEYRKPCFSTTLPRDDTNSEHHVTRHEVLRRLVSPPEISITSAKPRYSWYQEGAQKRYRTLGYFAQSLPSLGMGGHGRKAGITTMRHPLDVWA